MEWRILAKTLLPQWLSLWLIQRLTLGVQDKIMFYIVVGLISTTTLTLVIHYMSYKARHTEAHQHSKLEHCSCFAD
ncbi:hypothetical protein ACRHK7_03135 [Weissella tructae]|uniref:Uncharacterized protein n=2 Tax=Weissella TaxID=46255 RepID=A0A075U0W0_9LACO|nr:MULTISPECIES: hypothetical protein [Weissella]AIG66156.1 hypothetical protein WS08_1218 [Weissella tructae]AIM63537.1 hypothetical protein WS74_1288 [Weissella ceti]AIM64873.1 hypothetical protein WS105_1283 [Weissella ceti]QVV91305.1 hypothetical protein KHQ32_06750 [Weissella tructae]